MTLRKMATKPAITSKTPIRRKIRTAVLRSRGSSRVSTGDSTTISSEMSGCGSTYADVSGEGGPAGSASPADAGAASAAKLCGKRPLERRKTGFGISHCFPWFGAGGAAVAGFGGVVSISPALGGTKPLSFSSFIAPSAGGALPLQFKYVRASNDARYTLEILDQHGGSFLQFTLD